MKGDASKYKTNWAYPDPKVKKEKSPEEWKWQRAFEILPGFLTWFTLIGMFLFSWWFPVLTAIFIILFDIYWIYRTFYIASYSIMGYRKLARWKKIDWRYRLMKIYEGDSLLKELKEDIKEIENEVKNRNISRKLKKQLKQRLLERRNFLKRAKEDLKNRDKFLDWNEVYHIILLPTAIEDAEIIEPAIEKIYRSNYRKDRIIILLAMEERESKEDRDKKEKILRDKYEGKFFDFVTTVHKVESHEMKCKAANATYAAKEMKKYLEGKNIPLENVMLSNFDCDTQAHPQYLAALTYAFVTEPKRLQHAYQPLPMYHNTIWDTIAPVRVTVTGSSFWHMVESMRPDHMVTFSSHSEPFKTIVDVDYWPVNAISEDSMIFWKAFNYYDGDYEVKPIYLPVSLDAVLGNTYWHTVKNQYFQKRRWAYGIENLPLLIRAFRKNRRIPLWTKIRHSLIMLEGHHSWATAPFILALLGWLPLILGGERFNELTLAHNLPYITRSLMTFAMIGLVVSMFLGFLMIPPKPKKYSRKKYVSFFFQWFLAPFIAPFLGASPAVDSQTRLMIGKYFGEFWVTEKVRKK